MMRWPPSAPCSPPCRRPGRRSPDPTAIRTGGPTSGTRPRTGSSVSTTRCVDAGLLVRQPLGERVALGDGGRLGQQRRLPLVGRPCAEALDHALQHVPVPLAVGEPREPFRRRVVEAAVVHAQDPAELAPALRAAEVDHDGAAVRRVEDAEDRRLGMAHDAGPVPFPMEDRRRVQEQERIEERGLDVLAVAGRGALDQRGAGAEDGHQRRRHAGHREGEPDRIVPGEQSLLRARPGRARAAPSPARRATARRNPTQ